jgi:hypothetical protein
MDGAFANGEDGAGVERLPAALLVSLPQKKVDALVAV